MAFDTDTYDDLSDDEKVAYLAKNKAPPEQVEDIHEFLKDADVPDGGNQDYHNALRLNVGEIQYVEEISNAFQTNTEGSVIEELNPQFTQTFKNTVTPNSSTYNKDIAFSIAKLSYFIKDRSYIPKSESDVPLINQDLFDQFIRDGELGTNTDQDKKDLRDALKTALAKFAKKSLGDAADDLETEDDVIAALQGEIDQENLSAATIAQNERNTSDPQQPTDADAGRFKQCMLMLEFLSKASAFKFQPKEASNTIWGDSLGSDHGYTKDAHHNRIIPLWCKKPDVFLNACNFNPKFKRYFSRKSTSDDSEYVRSIL